MAKLPYGQRDEGQDILASIIGGGIQGFGQAAERQQASGDALMKIIMPEIIKNKIAEASMPDWAKGGGGTPEGFNIRQTVKTPYGSASLVPKTTATFGTSTRQDALDTAQGVIKGIIPPDPQSSSFRDRTAVNAELARNDFDLSTANKDWRAANKFYSSMNSTQQIRLRQALNSVNGALDNLDQLNTEYQRSGFTPLNKAQLIANSKGVGSQAVLATKYLTQLAVIQDELSQVFMGGNSPTEKFLEQAQNILKGEFTYDQLQGITKTLRQNLRYRLNSINQAQAYTPYNKTAEEPNVSGGGQSLIPQANVGNGVPEGIPVEKWNAASPKDKNEYLNWMANKGKR